VELHRSWKGRLYGPLWLLAALTAFLAPTLLLPVIEYEFHPGNWICYPAGVVLLLIGAYQVREEAKPFLIRFDQTGVVWRTGDGHGAVPWPDVVRFGLEKKPDDPPRAKAKHLTLWVRRPLSGAGDPDVHLDGLVGYRLASVWELVESSEEIVAGLRRYTAALETLPAPAFAGGAPTTYADRRAPGHGECAVCGGGPAAFVILQSIGSIAVFHWKSVERGWRCHPCALATYRDLTNRTLLTCWWGVGFLGGPVVLLANRLRLRAALRLPQPTPTPGVVAPSPMPLDPGARLLARPGGFVGLLMGTFVTLALTFVIFSLIVYG
jgi:hypothetical protein